MALAIAVVVAGAVGIRLAFEPIGGAQESVAPTGRDAGPVPVATPGVPAALDPGASAGSDGSPAPSPTTARDSPPSAKAPGSGAAPARFPGGLLIADRGNGRLLIVTDSGRITWTFPVHGSLPRGQAFSADDAFVAPDGRTIVANDEAHQVVDRIDIASRRVIWQYGVYAHAGSDQRHLHTPDDAYPLPNGDVVLADIRNCRILEISMAKRVVREWGRSGACSHHPPSSFAMPNGDTPLSDGGLLVTEIRGSRVVRLGPDGRVVFDVHAPVAYPSDAQLTADGNIVVVDYANPGAVLKMSPQGRVIWRYRIASGPGRLDHPSLAVPLRDGTIALNDDFRHRVVVIDPRTDRIVWQYGQTGRPGSRPGSLRVPDGIDVVPPGVVPSR
jgi:outer membrane protein assembly factor BamB